jgi:CPA2 family monovalent cation:H+ antiporter-2
LAIAIPDPVATEAAIAIAKRLNPTIDIIARASGAEGHAALRNAGASEVVHPQFEAGLEFVRHSLQRFSIPEDQVHDFVNERRNQNTTSSIHDT